MLCLVPAGHQVAAPARPQHGAGLQGAVAVCSPGISTDRRARRV